MFKKTVAVLNILILLASSFPKTVFADDGNQKIDQILAIVNKYSAEYNIIMSPVFDAGKMVSLGLVIPNGTTHVLRFTYDTSGALVSIFNSTEKKTVKVKDILERLAVKFQYLSAPANIQLLATDIRFQDQTSKFLAKDVAALIFAIAPLFSKYNLVSYILSKNEKSNSKERAIASPKTKEQENEQKANRNKAIGFGLIVAIVTIVAGSSETLGLGFPFSAFLGIVLGVAAGKFTYYLTTELSKFSSKLNKAYDSASSGG